jgi:hypothetical protein
LLDNNNNKDLKALIAETLVQNEVQQHHHRFPTAGPTQRTHLTTIVCGNLTGASWLVRNIKITKTIFSVF